MTKDAEILDVELKDLTVDLAKLWISTFFMFGYALSFQLLFVSWAENP